MLKTKRFGDLTFYYRGDTVDERVLEHSFENDHFYPNLFDFKTADRMTIIDVGAHIGTFSALSSMKFKQSKIIGIEPNPESMSIFRKNLEANNIKNVYPLEAALNSESGSVKLNLSQENWLHSITNEFGGDYIEVQSVTLKEIFKDHQVLQCDLLKMNCEGAEFKIILGLSLETLAKIKMILIQFHEDLVGSNFNRKLLISHLKKNNFSVRKLKMREHRGWIVARNKTFYKDFLSMRKLQHWFTLFTKS